MTRAKKKPESLLTTLRSIIHRNRRIYDMYLLAINKKQVRVQVGDRIVAAYIEPASLREGLVFLSVRYADSPGGWSESVTETEYLDHAPISDARGKMCQWLFQGIKP